VNENAAVNEGFTVSIAVNDSEYVPASAASVTKFLISAKPSKENGKSNGGRGSPTFKTENDVQSIEMLSVEAHAGVTEKRSRTSE